MKRGTPDSPKFKRLCRLLKVSTVQAVGHLELLWHFTADYASTGDVGKWSDDDIADACGWDGDAAAFVDALVLARWLDPCQQHRLVVHDWSQHADNATFRKLQRLDASARGVAEKDGVPPFATPTGIPEEYRGSWRARLQRPDDGGQCRDGVTTAEPAVATESRQKLATRPHQAPPDQTERALRARARDVGEGKGNTEDVGEDQGAKPEHPAFGPDRDHVGKSPRRLTDEELSTLRPVAERILERWAKEARQADPKNPDLEPGAWSINRDTWIGQLLPELTRYGADVVEGAIPWAMTDLGDDGWSGWRSVLDSPAALIGALRRGSFVKQYRTAQQRGRENGHARRPTGPEPPDYQAAAAIRAKERARQAAELKDAAPPSDAVRARLRAVAGTAAGTTVAGS